METLQMEITMPTPEPAYTVKIGDLSRRLGLDAMDLVRLCDIGVSTAYKAVKNEFVSLDTCHKVYNGLKKAGYQISWEDVVEVN